MKLSTPARHVVAALLDLDTVTGRSGRPVKLASIAQRTGHSLSYLEQLFARLRRAGVVVSVRGPGGGYRLAVPADALKLSVIVTAVDGPLRDDATIFGLAERAAWRYLEQVTLAAARMD